MAQMQTQGFCKTCGRNTLHTRQTFGLGWGCLLTILTGGLFIPIWIIIAVVEASKPWRCQVCGSGKLIRFL